MGTNMDPIPKTHLSFNLVLIFLTFSPTSAETGLLVVGGEGGLQSVEFWTPAPLSDSVNGEVILCSDSSCLRLEEGKWKEVAQLTEKRWRHSSAVTSRGLMLLGGQVSPNTTELVSLEEGGT